MKYVKSFFKYLSVILVLMLALGPMYWILVNSFKPTPELVSATPTFWPRTWTLEHYVNLFKQVNFVQYFLNSLWVALIATVISIILGALGAYSIYRCRYPGRNLFFGLFLSIYIFPRVLLLIPLYVTFSKIGLIDTIWTLVIVNVTVVAPFSVWLLRAFFSSVPRELEEAALVDGASRLQVLYKIFLPISAPGLGALGLNSFLLCWTEYMFAAIFILSDANKTLPVGMAYFLEQYFIDWGLLMSSSVLIALPAIIVFAIAGRYFVEGLTAGAVKE
ncbi:MAG TPA: carbohydrate ABC transporter permease [Limnochordia bacterium]|jgi:multiple sugar transport system permease protein|nr:carbohydrate ABC transporter permease [Limnochordia bacterium]